MSSTLALAIAVVLLAANAFFVGAEFAIISARRSSIEPLAEAGDRRARTVLWAMEHVSLMLACAQLGITVCSTSLGVVAEPAIAHLIEEPLHALGVSPAWTHPIAFVVALAVVVFLHVVLGEMVPKNLAVSGPDRAVLLFGPPLVWVARVVRPVIWALNWLANHVLRLFGVEPKDEVASAFTAQEVQSIVERSQAEGLLEDEQGLLTTAIEFSDKRAVDVMVGLDDAVVLRRDVTPAAVEELVGRTGFSRFPVADDDGEPVGYLHVKDVLYAEGSERDLPVPAWRLRALAVAGVDDEIETVLAAMQRSGAHLARVLVDGSCTGVVFLEDILEELVGEVSDAMQRGSLR
ncbi:hemolysin family protein [Cellulomonas massiliensis]|uniref:hemolysin family protein n=1 Tax=Cellulomonas massiliensis TaxID=1465811 RepID=UPI0002ED015F|nr:hemolysin family protein [Cellulomonas massiliensis]